MSDSPPPTIALFEYYKDFYRRHRQEIILVGILLALFLGIVLMGRLMAGVIVAIILAYLLEGPVSYIEKRRVSRWLAVLAVYFVFVISLLATFFALVPVLIAQTGTLLSDLPDYVRSAEEFLEKLPEEYPDYVDEATVAQLLQNIRSYQNELTNRFFGIMLSILRHGFTFIVYLVLVPLMVFFFIKDKDKILAWMSGFLPQERTLAQKVWGDTNRQIANFIRGKFWEVLIVGTVATIAFLLLGLDFAILFGVLTGLSVLIPYIGATVVTFPIALVAWFQFGMGPDFIYVLSAYLIIQMLDGNVLFPLLFSKVVHLHPLAILVALIFFGGIWGFWGLFFAIPLATLINAVISSWPRKNDLATEPAK
ncbi:MAG: AI-2E family transporter [Opitutales bacterium]|nr:AI-2E family transporter [Opitutales bacterium]